VRADEKATRFSVWNRLATVTRAAESAGVRWVCLPFIADTRAHAKEWRLAAVEVVRRFPRTFVNFMVAEQGDIYHDALAKSRRPCWTSPVSRPMASTTFVSGPAAISSPTRRSPVLLPRG